MDGLKGTALRNAGSKSAGLALDPRSVLCSYRYLLVAAVLQLCFGPSLHAQQRTIEARHMLSNQASKRGVGSARNFYGRVAIYHVFAGDSHSSWTGADKNEILGRLSEAYAFLNQQSELHNRKLQFVEQIGPDVQYRKRLPTGTFVNPEWTEEVLRQASKISSAELVKRLKKNHQADNVVLCLHVNKPALSYNLAYYENVSEEFSSERMVCFTTYPDSRPTSAATYAHEILHLFGAGDLYFPYDQDDYRKQIAKRYFPNDVMFRVDYNLYRLNVGAFTAYRVGWRPNLDAAHKLFED